MSDAVTEVGPTPTWGQRLAFWLAAPLFLLLLGAWCAVLWVGELVRGRRP